LTYCVNASIIINESTNDELRLENYKYRWVILILGGINNE